MTSTGHILVIDDDQDQIEFIQRTLENSGYQVTSAQDGHTGLRAVFDIRPDIILLDIIMPNMDGFETCRRIREITDIPIVMLTNRRSDQDLIDGLEAGADDYIMKPVAPDVLEARIKTVMRRAQMPPSRSNTATIYKDSWLHIDIPRYIVEVNNSRVSLSATEFNLLALLLRNAGEVMTFEQILTNVWGAEYQDEIAYVRVYISHLRHKIEPDPSNPTYIVTERQIGYRFVTPNR